MTVEVKYTVAHCGFVVMCNPEIRYTEIRYSAFSVWF